MPNDAQGTATLIGGVLACILTALKIWSHLASPTRDKFAAGVGKVSKGVGGCL